MFDTHQAHVIAAARTRTSSPAGPVLYHFGEFWTAVMRSVLGGDLASQIAGPLADMVNSPIQSREVLAARRDTVASSFVAVGRWGLHTGNPRLRVMGVTSLAVGNLLNISERQTHTQYKMLTSPSSPKKLASGASQVFFGPEFNSSTVSEQHPSPEEEFVPATEPLSPFTVRLYDAAFNPPHHLPRP